MKLLTPTEVKLVKDTELQKDQLRVQSTKLELDRKQKELSDLEVRFASTLANQKVTWAKAEEDQMRKITDLTKEIEQLEENRNLALVPIDIEKKKAHDMFIEAEAIMADLRQARKELDQKRQDNETESEYLQTRLDGISERENNVEEREKRVTVREFAIQSEKLEIKQLSQDLLNKLQAHG